MRCIEQTHTWSHMSDAIRGSQEPGLERLIASRTVTGVTFPRYHVPLVWERDAWNKMAGRFLTGIGGFAVYKLIILRLLLAASGSNFNYCTWTVAWTRPLHAHVFVSCLRQFRFLITTCITQLDACWFVLFNGSILSFSWFLESLVVYVFKTATVSLMDFKRGWGFSRSK